MKIIERLILALAWLQIAVSPVTIGAIAGVLIWLVIRGPWGLCIGIIVALVGCGAGVAFAEKVRRDQGTLKFMARNIGHPELRQGEEKI